MKNKFLLSFLMLKHNPLMALFMVLTIVAVAVSYFTQTPEGMLMLASAGVAWPYGDCDVQTPAYAATLPVTIADQLTLLAPATLTGALTINLTIGSNVRKGALLHVKLTSDGTARTTTFGTGFTSVALAGVINKTLVQTFIYDGSTFVPIGGGFQIN